jgi:ribosomal-protein-alanine N-acetyltransferase
VPDDLDALCRLWREPEARRPLFGDREVSREQALALVVRSVTTFVERGYGLWLVRAREPGEAGGVDGFAGLLLRGEGPPNLVYGVRRGLDGRGLAAEASHAVLAHAFAALGLERVCAEVDEPSGEGVRVLEGLGMTLERRAVVNGRPRLHYQLRADRWRP